MKEVVAFLMASLLGWIVGDAVLFVWRALRKRMP